MTSVTGVSTGVPKFSQKLLVTVTGTALDRGLSVSSPACSGMTLSSTAPNVSTATTAYFQCTVSAVGVSRVGVAAATGGAELGSVSVTVPSPQVTMAVSNGAAVNGSFVITLDPAKAPITVNNFLSYVNAGFYDGRDAPATKTVFHRVIAGFVVQGGGITPYASGATPVVKAASAPIALEVGVGLSNVQWSVAMARGNTANSANSQFFINLVDNSASNDPSSVSAGYAVFGNVSAGTAVVTSMLAAPCAPIVGLSECAPNPNIVITSATQTQ
ncbi:MAG: peptidylprolyl isomerase [Microbacteriaceae bacterium]|nr:peptidylprolyl isomerase [Burkholderiaceae bacterium]